jgi:hypothetical protein
MAHSDHGIVRRRAEEQPTDKERARTAHHTNSAQSASREATRDPELDDQGTTAGAGARSGESHDRSKH